MRKKAARGGADLLGLEGRDLRLQLVLLAAVGLAELAAQRGELLVRELDLPRHRGRVRIEHLVQEREVGRSVQAKEPFQILLVLAQRLDLGTLCFDLGAQDAGLRSYRGVDAPAQRVVVLARYAQFIDELREIGEHPPEVLLDVPDLQARGFALVAFCPVDFGEQCLPLRAEFVELRDRFVAPRGAFVLL